MARITIEDCLKQIPNRFDIVIYASKRARQLEKGAEPMVEPQGDKPTVIALREIGDHVMTKESIDRAGTIQTMDFRME